MRGCHRSLRAPWCEGQVARAREAEAEVSEIVEYHAHNSFGRGIDYVSSARAAIRGWSEIHRDRRARLAKARNRMNQETPRSWINSPAPVATSRHQEPMDNPDPRND